MTENNTPPIKLSDDDIKAFAEYIELLMEMEQDLKKRGITLN